MILSKSFSIRLLAIVIAYISFFIPILLTEDQDSFFVLKYIDELLAVCGGIYIMRNFATLSKMHKRIIYMLILLTFIGLIGTYINQLQTGMFPVLLDIFAFWKVFVVFIWGDSIVGRLDEKSKRKIVKKINIILIPWIMTAFVLAIANVFVDIGLSDEFRFGRRCFAFFYPKSSTFSNLFYIFILLIVLNYFYSPKIRHLIVLGMTLIVWFLTLRSRAILFVLIFILMYFWLVYQGKKIKSKIFPLLLLLSFSLFVVGEKIDDTYNNDAAPRALLLTYGIKTMLTYMPIGAGFGTYGTDIACTYYSKLYVQYGFVHAYGLNPSDTRYAHDSYWPAVMGEMGLLGVLLMAGVVFLWSRIVIDYSSAKLKYMLCLFIIITQIMASLPTSVFFQNNTAFLFLLLPLLKDSHHTHMRK